MKSLRRHTRSAALIFAVLLLATPAAAQRRKAAPRSDAPPAPAAASRRQPQDVERPVETSVSAESYAVYAEVRRVGQLARTNEVRTAIDSLRLLGDAPREVTDVIDFVIANEEALGDARLVVSTMSARADIPQFLLALQFQTPEAARGFEAKLRAFFNDPSYVETGAPQKGRGARRARAKRTAAPTLVVKRAGSWLYASDQEFTFKSLRGDGASLIANNARLQSFRSRLASEPVFVYFDTALSKRGWQLQMEKAQKQMESAQANAPAGVGGKSEGMQTGVLVGPVVIATGPAEGPVAEEAPPSLPPPAPVEAEATLAEAPTPEVEPTGEGETEAPAVVVEDKQPAAVAARSAEERAAEALLSTLMSGIFSGGVREPDAVGVAVGFEGDAVAARVLVAKEANEPATIIPFFPNVVSGPAIVPESLSVAPADSEVFLTASLDWARIYDTLIAGLNKPVMLRDGRDRDGGEEVMQTTSAEKTVEAMEKLFGFKVKDELLPALGNEVAVSLPLDWFEGKIKRRGEEMSAEFSVTEEARGEKKAKAGPVVIISLNNPDAVRKVMPLLLVALGQRGQGQAERRKGFEIQDLGAVAYAFVNNFLVVGESAPAVRHVVDAYSSNQTLAASSAFRDSVAWQEHQRLALAYLSDGLMRQWGESAKKAASGSADPVVLAALAHLDAPPAAVSYAATNDGDALLHELRVPTGLLKVYAASMLIGIKEAPVLGNEATANYALARLVTAEQRYKNEKGKGRYGSVEELLAEKLIDREYAMTDEYAIELRASGDKFTLTATPKNYGKTGRRSFFADETGVVRGADHKGEPATAADPPVDQ